MKSFLIGLSVCFLAMTAGGQTPNYDYPFLVTNAAGYILPDNICVIPEFGDWDGDGDADMMVGIFYYGNILYYENVSTGTTPVFGPADTLRAGGVKIAVTYG
jgi:hypothetical protein